MPGEFILIWAAVTVAAPTTWASREPSRLFIASDANPFALSRIAWRTGRKASRGGISNLICIAEPLDVLAANLAAIANRITVILPWGSLLAAVAGSNLDSLCQIARLCLPGATVEVVLSYDGQRDARKGNPLGAISLDAEHVAGTLPRRYEQAGLPLVAIDRISNQDLATFQTTWAKRLAFGRERTVWRLQATCVGL